MMINDEMRNILMNDDETMWQLCSVKSNIMKRENDKQYETEKSVINEECSNEKV